MSEAYQATEADDAEGVELTGDIPGAPFAEPKDTREVHLLHSRIRFSQSPPVSEVIREVGDAIRRLMSIGEQKHGAHIWFDRETVRHHADRASRHISTAMMIRDGNQPITDGENELDHLERAIVRAAFAYIKVKEGHR